MVNRVRMHRAVFQSPRALQCRAQVGMYASYDVHGARSAEGSRALKLASAWSTLSASVITGSSSDRAAQVYAPSIIVKLFGDRRQRRRAALSPSAFG
jgi:hypothetical protein